jgi:hypothetical protein
MADRIGGPARSQVTAQARKHGSYRPKAGQAMLVNEANHVERLEG